ncbi:MAG: class I SAM-dependent methyltransferase [Candidatus Kapaibacteriales bacterium]
MIRKLRKAINILINEGFAVFWMRTKNFFFYLYNRYFFPILPFAILKVWFLKRNKLNSDELVDISFSILGGLMRPLQIKEEISKLLQILDNIKPKVIIEIGTANGGTLFLLSRIASDDATIISIDLPKGKFGGGYPSWKIPFYKSFRSGNQKIFLLRCDSHSEATLEKVKSILKGKGVDFLLIDGDHSYNGVKKDFLLYHKLVKSNGTIAMHDIVLHPFTSECQVDKFWAELKNKYQTLEIISSQNQIWAGIGLIFMQKP